MSELPPGFFWPLSNLSGFHVERQRSPIDGGRFDPPVLGKKNGPSDDDRLVINFFFNAYPATAAQSPYESALGSFAAYRH